MRHHHRYLIKLMLCNSIPYIAVIAYFSSMCSWYSVIFAWLVHVPWILRRSPRRHALEARESDAISVHSRVNATVRFPSVDLPPALSPPLCRAIPRAKSIYRHMLLSKRLLCLVCLFYVHSGIENPT